MNLRINQVSMDRRRLRRLGAVVALALCSASSVAHASDAADAMGQAYVKAGLLALPLLLVPSNIGPEVRFQPGLGPDFRFVIGWPFQIPLEHTLKHRLMIAPELAFGTTDGALFRGRGGYRFGWRMLVAGLGIGADKQAFFITPELGVRFPSAERADFGGLLAMRCDLETTDKIVRLSVMIGWVIL